MKKKILFFAGNADQSFISGGRLRQNPDAVSRYLEVGSLVAFFVCNTSLGIINWEIMWVVVDPFESLVDLLIVVKTSNLKPSYLVSFICSQSSFHKNLMFRQTYLIRDVH